MVSGLIKKTVQKTKEEAVKTSNQVLGELAEIPREALKESIGIGSNQLDQQTSEVVEGMYRGSTDSSSYSQEEGERKRARRLNYLQYLQKEIEKLKRQRESEEENKRLSEEYQKEGQKRQEKKILPVLTQIPKRKIGLPFFSRKMPKGTGEVVKTSK